MKFQESTSDHLTPQETTKEDAPEVGTDGPELSCPGSSVVADSESERLCSKIYFSERLDLMEV